MAHLLFEKRNHIATITFNRPEVRNAYSPEMALNLTRYLRECDADPEVRVVIITGAGKAFCVGLDMNDVRERGQKEKPKDTDGHPTQRVLRTYPYQISKPVICAINGAAGGFGAAYPLTCDIRLAAAEASIAFSFVKWGLVPEMGATWTLPRLIGIEKTSDLLLTGRKITGAEAEQIGLVLRAVPGPELMEETNRLSDGNRGRQFSLRRLSSEAHDLGPNDGRRRVVSSHLRRRRRHRLGDQWARCR